MQLAVNLKNLTLLIIRLKLLWDEFNHKNINYPRASHKLYMNVAVIATVVYSIKRNLIDKLNIMTG